MRGGKISLMKKVLSGRILILLAALGILLALISLAISLENLHFQPGRIIYQNESQEIQFSIDKIVEGIVDIPFWKQALFWISAFFVVFLVAFLFPPELRKRIINYFLRLVVFLVLVYFIYKNYRVLFPDLDINLNTQVTIGDSQIPEATIPEFSAPQFSSSTLYFISFLIIRQIRRFEIRYLINGRRYT